MNTGLKIKKLRRDKNLTLLDVATKLKVQPTTVSNYENGKTPIPSDKLAIMASIYEVSMDDLLSESTSPNEKNKTDDSGLMEELKSTLEYLKNQIDILNNEKSRLYDVIDRLTENFPRGNNNDVPVLEMWPDVITQTVFKQG